MITHTLTSLQQQAWEAAEEEILSKHHGCGGLSAFTQAEIADLVEAKYQELLASLLARPDLLHYLACGSTIH